MHTLRCSFGKGCIAGRTINLSLAWRYLLVFTIELLIDVLACFNVVTGDVEDAPALDPLAKFEVLEKDGAVYIIGDEDVVKSNFPKPFSLKCMAQGSEKVVVVGG
jgi:hypothetical protein